MERIRWVICRYRSGAAPRSRSDREQFFRLALILVGESLQGTDAVPTMQVVLHLMHIPRERQRLSFVPAGRRTLLGPA